MRLIEDNRTIERVALGSETGFTIKAVGKAFRILSSNLYQDKIRAIIRELSCNAYDAHVAAGWPERAFTVHLPNPLEPYFAVRDSGVGLSPDEVTTVYTTYFESTKTESNDYIGALGLGSKAPFSYVDSFAICSWHQGTCYRYAAFISEQGTPVITLLSQTPTDEANGLEVSLPVQRADDFREFAVRARHVLEWFQPRPEVTGWTEFSFPDPAVLLQGDGWRITENAFSPIAMSRAIMGNVAYPVDPTALSHSKAGKIYQIGLDISFPIGSLDITAGRESLSYDPATLAAMEQRAQAIIADAPARFQHAFDACPTLYAAHSLYGRLFRSGLAGSMLDLSAQPMRYRDTIITSTAALIDLADHPDVMVEIYADSKHFQRKVTYLAGLSSHVHVPAEPDVVVVVDDLTKRSDLRNRIAYARKTSPRTALFLLLAAPHHIAPVLALLDGFPVRYASKMARAPSTRARATPVQAMRMTSRTFHSYVTQFDTDCWESATIDPAKGGLYIQRRGHLVLQDKQASARFIQALRQASVIGLLDHQTPIYGFNVTMLKRYADIPGWINLPDHLHSVILDRIAQRSDILCALQTQYLEAGRPDLTKQRQNVVRLGRALPSDHPIAEFASIWDAAHKQHQSAKMETLRHICELLRIGLPDSVFALERQWKSFRNIYPLLSIVECDNRLMPPQISTDHLVGYIQWVDQSRATATSSPLPVPQLQLV